MVNPLIGSELASTCCGVSFTAMVTSDCGARRHGPVRYGLANTAAEIAGGICRGADTGNPLGIDRAAALGALNEATVFDRAIGDCIPLETPGVGWSSGATGTPCGVAIPTPG